MRRVEVIAIGGSAGSFRVVTEVLDALPARFALPVLLCLHRLKQDSAGFREQLASHSLLPVVEPSDKDGVRGGVVYLAPANYHMYVAGGNLFQLTDEEEVHHSRPSIDITFASVARQYGARALGVILSGANRDGVEGLRRIQARGGETIVQSPETSAIRTMPEACLEARAVDQIMTPTELVERILQLGRNEA